MIEHNLCKIGLKIVIGELYIFSSKIWFVSMHFLCLTHFAWQYSQEPAVNFKN